MLVRRNIGEDVEFTMNTDAMIQSQTDGRLLFAYDDDDDDDDDFDDDDDDDGDDDYDE